MTKSNTPRTSCLSKFFGLLIDLSLMGMGAALYIHFKIYSFGPIDLSPAVVNIFGSKDLAVGVIAGVPFVLGMLSFLLAVPRLFRG